MLRDLFTRFWEGSGSVMTITAGLIVLQWLTAPLHARDDTPEKPKTAQKKESGVDAALDLKASSAGEKPPSKAELKKRHDEWVKRFQGAVKKLNTGSADEVERVEALILETHDASALGPMLQVMGRESAPIRLLMDRALAGMEGDLAWVALAERLLIEPEADVRRGLVRLVAEHQEKPGYALFLKHIRVAITSKNMVRNGLGAMAAADLNWRDQVPELVGHLAPVRLASYVEWVPEPVSAGGGLSYGSVKGYVSVPVPVVGPGVVAYGQNIIPVGSGLSMGGGGSGVSMRPVMREGLQAVPNPAVLSSLIQLTGVDFGYDVAAWKEWLATSFRREEKQPKRVPNP